MKNLEPGMMCRVAGSLVPENNGKIVTLVAFVSTPPIHLLLDDADAWEGKDWWQVDQDLTFIISVSQIKSRGPYIRACRLQPIDHQPADEQFTADFMRIISAPTKGSERVKNNH